MCAGACFCDACTKAARNYAFGAQHLDKFMTREGHWRRVWDGRKFLGDGRQKVMLRRDGGGAG